MTAASSSSSCHLLLVLRSQPPLPLPSPSPSSSSSFISFLKPFFLPSSNITLRKFHLLPKNTLFPTFLSTPPSSSRSFPYTPPLSSFITGSTSKSIEENNTVEEEEEEEEEEEYDEETDFSEDEFETKKENFEDAKVVENSTSSPLVRQREERLKVKLPNLSVKEKKELGSYANSLGRKLKTQLVGKSGVTPNLITAFSDNLEANELLKIKIHGSCPSELDDVVKQLEEATGSVTVGQIGRTLILYRPSLSKLKVEEKRKQFQKVYLEKQRKRRLIINRGVRKQKNPNHRSEVRRGK